MGKEDDKKKKDKDKDKKDKDKKDKDKKDKDKKDDKHKDDKKDKDKKDKDKKDKDKDKDKDKKDKDKKEKKEKEPSDWKIPLSASLDNQIAYFQAIANKLKDIDNYILKESANKEEFVSKVKKSIEDMDEATKNIFLALIANI